MASSSSITAQDVAVALVPIDSCHVIPSVIIADPETAFPQQVIIEELDDNLTALVNRIITDANLGAWQIDIATDCEIYYELNKPPSSNRRGLNHATVPATDIKKRLSRSIKDPDNPLLFFVYYIGKAREAHRKEGLIKASYAARAITQPKTQPIARTPARDVEPRGPNQVTTPKTPTSQGARSFSSSTSNSSRPKQLSSITTPSPRRLSPTSRPQQRLRAAPAPQADAFIFTASDDDLEHDRQTSRNQLASSSQSPSQSRIQRVNSSPARARSVSPVSDGEPASAVSSSVRASTKTSSKEALSGTSSSHRQNSSSHPVSTNDRRGRVQPASHEQPDVTGRKRRRSPSPSAQTYFREYDVNSYPVLYAGDMKSFMCQLCKSDISMPQRFHLGTVKRHFQRTKLLNHQSWLDFNPWALPKTTDAPQRAAVGTFRTDEEDESAGLENDHEETDEEADRAVMTRDGPDASEARD